MEFAVLIAAAALLIVGAAVFADKLGVASSLVLVVLGAALSFVPGTPDLPIEPDWFLALVLPPLLYAAAVNVPVVDFRRNITPIASLGVGAVLLSAFATGTVLWLVLPDLDFAAAVALGAVVSPTDAVAATSIAHKVGLPHRLVTVLEGESLVNDATALVLLRTAIAAVGGSISLGGAIAQFVWAVLGAALVGVAVGALSVVVRARFTEEILGTVLSFVVPFIAYVIAEEIDASGVIAVVAAGLVIGHQSARHFTARARLSERTNWRTVQFVLENGVFLLMGFQLAHYVADVERDGYGVVVPLVLTLAVAGVLVLTRAVFVAPMIGWMRRSERRSLERGATLDQRAGEVRAKIEARRDDLGTREVTTRISKLDRRIRRRAADLEFFQTQGLSWRGGAIIAWAGMRGVVTVAAAESLPATIPYRSELVLVAFGVAAFTLALGGLTLPMLIRALGVRPDATDNVTAERAELVGQVCAVAKDALANPDLVRDDGKKFDPEVIAQVSRELDTLTRVATWRRQQSKDSGRVEQLRELRSVAVEAQQSALLDARASGSYSSAALRQVQGVIDAASVRAGP